jgi:hypothetical protein
MSATRAITVRLDPADYARLAEEAARLGLSPGTLARVYVRSGLAGGGEDESERRRRAGRAALEGLAALRSRLPVATPIDIVDVIHGGRADLDERLVT